MSSIAIIKTKIKRFFNRLLKRNVCEECGKIPQVFAKSPRDNVYTSFCLTCLDTLEHVLVFKEHGRVGFISRGEAKQLGLKQNKFFIEVWN